MRKCRGDNVKKIEPDTAIFTPCKHRQSAIYSALSTMCPLPSPLSPTVHQPQEAMGSPALLLLLAVLAFQRLLTVAGGDWFVRTRGTHFMLDGVPYYANGFNAYWLMYMASDPSQRSKVSNAFREAASHGLTVARTWAFSDGGYRPLQYSPGSYNEQTFQVPSHVLLHVITPEN